MDLGAPLPEKHQETKTIDKRIDQERRPVENDFERIKEGEASQPDAPKPFQCLLPL